MFSSAVWIGCSIYRSGHKLSLCLTMAPSIPRISRLSHILVTFSRTLFTTRSLYFRLLNCIHESLAAFVFKPFYFECCEKLFVIDHNKCLNEELFHYKRGNHEPPRRTAKKLLGKMFLFFLQNINKQFIHQKAKFRKAADTYE